MPSNRFGASNQSTRRDYNQEFWWNPGQPFSGGGLRPNKHLSDSERWFLAKHSDFCTLLYLEISTLGAA
jgi:hypothetical protein